MPDEKKEITTNNSGTGTPAPGAASGTPPPPPPPAPPAAPGAPPPPPQPQRNEKINPLFDGPVMDNQHGHKDIPKGQEYRQNIPPPEQEINRPFIKYEDYKPGATAGPAAPGMPGAAPTPQGPPPGMTEAEEDVAVKESVNMYLNTYGEIKTVVGNFAKIDEKKLKKKFDNGDIDPNLTFNLGLRDTEVSFIQFAEKTNGGIDVIFKTTEEFKNRVRPPLIRIVKKHKGYLTDENMVIAEFGKDVLQTGLLYFNIKRNWKYVENQAKEATLYYKQMAEELRKQNEREKTPPAAPAYTPPKQDYGPGAENIPPNNSNGGGGMGAGFPDYNNGGITEAEIISTSPLGSNGAGPVIHVNAPDAAKVVEQDKTKAANQTGKKPKRQYDISKRRAKADANAKIK